MEVHSAKGGISETQPKCHWTKTLEKIELKNLEVVSTLAIRDHTCVSLVQLRRDETSAFVLKKVEKSKLKSPDQRKNIMAEKKILREVQSDFVMKLYATFKDNKFLYFLTEYLPGGELLHNVKKIISEDGVRFYIGCVVEALDCLHKKNIAHNDVKLSNLMLDAEGYVKLIDFGFAFQLPPGEKKHGFQSGTLQYMPPEALYGPRDRAGDLWALGVLLYKLLGGKLPFNTDGESKTTWKNILKGIDSVRFPEVHFSEEAKCLIKSLCRRRSDSRLGYESIEEIRKHRWFDGFDWEKLRNRQLTPPIVPKLDSVVDTNNFSKTIAVYDDSKVEEDDSDWDMEF